MLRAVMFDLDGTLLDSLADLARAMNASLADAGLPTHPVDAYKYFVGDGVENLARRAAPADRRDDPETIRRLVAGHRRHYAGGWSVGTAPYPGIPELLAQLADRRVAAAVLSNKPDDFTREIIAHYFPGHAFGAVRGARLGVPVKPDPAGALAIAEQMGVPPADWLYLGDTDTDMRTARAAGMVPAGVAWGFRPAEELVAAGAAHILRRPADAWPLLEGDVR